MISYLDMTPSKTYATRDNAIKAVEKKFGSHIKLGDEKLDFVIVANAAGRFFPLFLGERAIRAGVHFHFCVAN